MRTQAITGTVRLLFPILALVAANAHGATPAALGVDDSRIAVTAVAGSVDVTMAGRPVAVRRDSAVLLPARIVTGRDGMLGMTQAGTTITVSNDTDIEIPAEAVDGNLVARLVQHQGNVFYDVAPRDLGKLRVETPFLVAVIKGTQFNVAVQADRTTISLFEGQLEILSENEGNQSRIRVAGKGELIGEMAIFERQPRSATVRALGEARVLTVDRKNFLRRINEDPSLAFRLVETMSHRVRELSAEIVRLKAARAERGAG